MVSDSDLDPLKSGINAGTDAEGHGEWGKKYVGKIIDRKSLNRVISVKRKVDQFFDREEF